MFGKQYGVTQLVHGADHVWVFDEDELCATLPQEMLANLPKTTEERLDVAFFPIGGSKSAPSSIELLETEEAIRCFLVEASAFGPDLEDPQLVDLAEYYWHIETDRGCGEKWLQHFHLDKEAVETAAMKSVDDLCNDICNTLGISLRQFYDTPYAEMRVSEILP